MKCEKYICKDCYQLMKKKYEKCRKCGSTNLEYRGEFEHPGRYGYPKTEIAAATDDIYSNVPIRKVGSR